MDYTLYDAFNQFVSQIQFSINSFLVVFGIIIAVVVGIGAYFAYTVSQKSAKAGIDGLKEDIQFREGLTKRMDVLENSQKEVKRYVSSFGSATHEAPLGAKHGNSEQIIYTKNNGTLYVSGTFIPCGYGDIVATLPFGYRPPKDTRILAFSDTPNTILIKSNGVILSNIPESECAYTFQAYLPTE